MPIARLLVKDLGGTTIGVAVFVCPGSLMGDILRRQLGGIAGENRFHPVANPRREIPVRDQAYYLMSFITPCVRGERCKINRSNAGNTAECAYELRMTIHCG